MLLAVDIGNTNIKFGVFDGDKLVSQSMTPTDPVRHDDSSGLKILDELKITAAIVCSVVREANETVKRYLVSTYDVDPVFVSNDFDFGLKIKYEPLESAGTDRLVNAFSAAEQFGVPCMVCSFGTATTVDVVDRDRTLIGGMIAPGFGTMAAALRLKTSQLPHVELKKPDNLLGNNTVDAVRSGIYHSQLGLVELVARQISNKLGVEPKVIFTGGFASDIASHFSSEVKLDESLTLKGLKMIYSRHSI